MMTKNKLLYARAGAAAIAAALVLSPIHATVPKPIVDLSKSPAVNGQPAAPPASQAKAKTMIGPFDEQTAEIGGGALAVLIVGLGAVAISSSRRKRRKAAEWHDEVADERDPLFDEPMFHHEAEAEAVEQPAIVAPEPSAFAWGNEPPCEQPSDDGSDRCRGETWVERAYRGPSPANPSVSLKARLHRAAFFDKRERDVAAGKAEPIDPDAGLPDAMIDEQELA